jgi:poly(3-hydroxybutyrate) depolymerase/peptidoglycan/LPS O-acetylase OafA/YrhL
MLHEKRQVGGVADSQIRRRAHVLAFDLIRLLVIGLVVGVHVLGNVGGPVTPVLGGFIMVFHTSRELFFLITALVLTYNYGERRQINWLRFWRARYRLVVPAYIVWTLIYFLADTPPLHPLSAVTTLLRRDLLTGGARYHLYFLLVTMQLYLVFPLVRWLLRRTEGHHGVLLAVAAAYQLALTAAIQLHATGPGPLGSWLHAPSEWLPSYVLYVIAGALAGWHFERLAEFTRRHARTAGLVAVAAAGAGAGTYCAELLAGGEPPVVASIVFQPVVVVESLGLAWGLLAAGLRWSDRGAKGRRIAAIGADCSFGIYLAHPLVLQGLVLLARNVGVQQPVINAPAPVELAVLLGVCVPVVYGVSWLLTFGLRRTPLSLVLAGRPMLETRTLPGLRWVAAGAVVLCTVMMAAGLQVARGDASASARADPVRTAPVRTAPVRNASAGKPKQFSTPAPPTKSASPPAKSAAAPAKSAAAPAKSASAPAKLISSDYSMRFDGQDRTWTRLAPVGGLPASAPVIVVLSGINATPAVEIARDHLTSYVQSGQAELVYPAGYRKSWNAGGCCGKAAAAGIDDTGFIEALAAAVDPGHKHPLDLVGYSNGGRLAYRIACTDPQLFGQIAVVKAMPQPGCVVSRPVTILQIDSTDDTAVPYQPGDKGKESPPATVQVARLESTDGCPATGTVQVHGSLRLTTWSDCADGTRLGFAVYGSGGHGFPQASGATPSAATVIWAFFTDSALP